MTSRIDTSEALKRIDSVLKDVEKKTSKLRRIRTKAPTTYNANEMMVTLRSCIRLKQTLMDMSPHRSVYWNFASKIEPPFNVKSMVELYGILQSLREEYANGFLRGFNELVDADLFEDILEQADYLRTQGFVRASAVVAGVALESHLRKLAEKNSISITNDRGKFVEAEILKNELYRNEIIDKTFNKHITSWLGLRNDAAHPDQKDIDAGLLEPMISGIRVLIEKYPA